MSDDIGHFENCLKLDAQFNCAVPGKQDAGGLDEDDGNNFCVPGSDSTLVHINGCFSSDGDWDGQSYQNDWPGTDPNVAWDQALHPSPVLFTSPLANGTTNYSTIAFETDLPRIEVAGSQDNPAFCNRTTGANCVNPPNGAQFYPFYSTRVDHGTCTWNVLMAGGRQLHPGYDKQLRGKLDHRIRTAAAHRVPSGRIHHDPAIQQLQQRRQGEPLPSGLNGLDDPLTPTVRPVRGAAPPQAAPALVGSNPTPCAELSSWDQARRRNNSLPREGISPAVAAASKAVTSAPM
jgi:hypothetical protein